MNKATRLSAALLVGTLSGCASATWFDFGDTVSVAEIGRATVCASDVDKPRLQLFETSGDVRLWERRTGIKLNPGFLDTSRYALIEMGQHNTGGYGLAVSSEARRSGNTLALNATFFTPTPGTMQTQMITSPCVLVKLPAGDYSLVQVFDQSGELRAAASVAASQE